MTCVKLAGAEFYALIQNNHTAGRAKPTDCSTRFGTGSKKGAAVSRTSHVNFAAIAWGVSI